MRKHIIFDVDGTLTPSRQSIDPKFKEWMIEFMKSHYVYLVTGSDHAKTVEQLGLDFCKTVDKIYNCCGNDIWVNELNLYTNPWQLDGLEKLWLESELEKSKYKTKTGKHIEERPGLVNFSIVGRNANLKERKEYHDWDNKSKERENIAKKLMKNFPYLSAVVGGETGIDIFPKGKDKSQILEDFHDSLIFFGDKTEPGGNDHSIAEAIKFQGGKVFQVNGYRETWKILKTLDKNQ